MKWQMLKMKMQEIAIDFLLWCGCVTLISTVWEVIEICYHGTAVASQEDTFIAFWFSALLWWVVRRWNKEVAEDG